MDSQLSEHQSVDFSSNINDLFLGVREHDGRVVVNAYLKQQISEERLLGLIVNFTFQGEELAFEVCELQRGIPMGLILNPVNNHTAVRDFLRNVVSVCLVPAVTFMENGEIFVVKNTRYNPNCLN
jgi:hypothetical protein